MRCAYPPYETGSAVGWIRRAARCQGPGTAVARAASTTDRAIPPKFGIAVAPAARLTRFLMNVVEFLLACHVHQLGGEFQEFVLIEDLSAPGRRGSSRWRFPRSQIKSVVPSRRTSEAGFGWIGPIGTAESVGVGAWGSALPHSRLHCRKAPSPTTWTIAVQNGRPRRGDERFRSGSTGNDDSRNLQHETHTQ
jgi:hypothetical protein